MNHLILISHGRLCEELKNSTEMIMGPQNNIHTVSLLASEGKEDFLNKFKEVTKDLDKFTVLADLMGGTPCNVVSQLIMQGEKFDIFTGMNMPMVIDFISNDFEVSPDDIRKNAKDSINYVNEILANSNDDDELE
ncbi:PTS sugar transporter subunit IIA [Miniphocaeibacter halophilus]|uniref:PTS sugar transporter subunit IIA n=1 Tax=Miniphocaeibacter halophilus TaxID=2931922 RepID=UPI001FB3082E|nr:PTS sugar transporter subunit IIA [Miniphocaeibacter halophilus]